MNEWSWQQLVNKAAWEGVEYFLRRYLSPGGLVGTDERAAEFVVKVRGR